MVENQSSRFLPYAIGEMLLVIVGILIALQINNWNEFNKERDREQAYYCKLHEDVEQDLVKIGDQLEKSEERLAASNRMLALLQQDAFSPEQVMQEAMQAISLITFTFRPSVAAFEDLKSSGNLSILLDNDLKTRILAYYSMIEGMLDVMDTNADGAVRKFYDKPDFAAMGWQHLDPVKDGLDPALVDLAAIGATTYSDESFRQRMTSDALFYVGANSRIKSLYQSVVPEMQSMSQALGVKCRQEVKGSE
ncbi:MAG: hypothetical protein GTO01_07070 [Xanthomonadales bacterium]|nr:hypothetical protein [Xanthomonadales bacterium]